MNEQFVLSDDPLKYDAQEFTREHSATHPALVAVMNDDLDALRALHATHGVAALTTRIKQSVQLTPLALAIFLHRRAAMTLLLSLGVPVDDFLDMIFVAGCSMTFGSLSVLQLAAMRSDVATLDELLASTTSDEAKHALCFYALHNSDPAVLSMLIQRGFDVHQSGLLAVTPIVAAAANPNKAFVDLLLAAGCDVSLSDTSRCSPIHVAARSNSNEKVVAALLAAGASVKARAVRDLTPVHFAAMNPNTAVMAELLKHCSVDDVNVVDDKGMTPCNLAQSREVLAALLAHGGEFGALESALGTAVDNANVLAVQHLLLKPKVDLSVRNRAGKNLLHRAASANSAEIVQILLDAGMDKDERCKRRARTALCYAAASRDALAFRVLVAAGADLYAADKESLTALHLACACDNMAALEMFATAGIDVVEAAKVDASLMCSAAQARDANVLRHLMRHGVDFRSRNSSGATPCVGASPLGLYRLFTAGANLSFKHNVGHNAGEAVLNAWCIDVRPILTMVAAGADVGADLIEQVNSVSRETVALLCACGDVDENTVDGGVEQKRIIEAVKMIAQRQFELMRLRAFEVVVGLQPLGLSALVTCEILSFTFAPRESLVPFHRLWKIATLAKHFRMS
jgi:ankyrin repeat protein